jgi:hypothetical protein
MQKLSQFSLETHSGPYEKWPRASRLFMNGHDTKRKITGFLIEAQYICDEGFLLVTSMDCPFEETSHFTLLDKNLKTIATKSPTQKSLERVKWSGFREPERSVL